MITPLGGGGHISTGPVFPEGPADPGYGIDRVASAPRVPRPSGAPDGRTTASRSLPRCGHRQPPPPLPPNLETQDRRRGASARRHGMDGEGLSRAAPNSKVANAVRRRSVLARLAASSAAPLRMLGLSSNA